MENTFQMRQFLPHITIFSIMNIGKYGAPRILGTFLEIKRGTMKHLTENVDPQENDENNIEMHFC